MKRNATPPGGLRACRRLGRAGVGPPGTRSSWPHRPRREQAAVADSVRAGPDVVGVIVRGEHILDREKCRIARAKPERPRRSPRPQPSWSRGHLQNVLYEGPRRNHLNRPVPRHPHCLHAEEFRIIRDEVVRLRLLTPPPRSGCLRREPCCCPLQDRGGVRPWDTDLGRPEGGERASPE
jgi:hypothetical protein